MLNMIPLDERVLVSAQIQPEDLPDIAKAGVGLVVNNRPDGEALTGQPTAGSIAQAASAQGVAFLDLPFTSGSLTPGHVAKFLAALNETEGQVLAYCRSGSRSSLLWGAAKVANGANVDDVLAQAQATGIDLSQARMLIDSLGIAAAGER